MKKLSLENIEPKPLTDNDNLYVINNPVIQNIYSAYLTYEIGESRHYRDLYNLLRNAGQDDTFIFYITNYGGYISTGMEIINSMKASQGKLICCLTGGCYSMAPLIALSAPQLFVQDDSFMMFHDYSGGYFGKGNEIVTQLAHEKPHFDDLFKKITNKFLTKKESNHILKGQDLYLGANEIRLRLKKLKRLGG